MWKACVDGAAAGLLGQILEQASLTAGSTLIESDSRKSLEGGAGLEVGCRAACSSSWREAEGRQNL